MNVLQDSNVVSLSDGVSYQPLGDGEGAVVLMIESGHLFTCNDTTSAFLSEVDGERSFGHVVSKLLETFDVSADKLRSDLSVLAKNLEQAGIVRIQ